MSELIVTLLKVLFLALLWVFILSAASVIRTDLFGRTVQAGELPQQLEQPRRRERRRTKQAPRSVEVTNGSREGQRADLFSGPVLIGRSSDCAIILDDDYVSTRHARIEADSSGGYYVEDLGSTNGTYVNGQRITAPTTVTPADSVRIGRTVLKLVS
ncbi:FHA domain-containing protein FhaB/FipA [Desertihabitans aurantiacus]|uniref:FHA domain-containing protein FhaB/FipA n=1 Tax=Desertihabitans aurantiacus TaxID=2282477 RepID=UPI000DF74246|nr:FHA domain-containing protein [Desertihabitans aurantiacus]